jgi:hypothetical protein
VATSRQLHSLTRRNTRQPQNSLAEDMALRAVCSVSAHAAPVRASCKATSAPAPAPPASSHKPLASLRQGRSDGWKWSEVGGSTRRDLLLASVGTAMATGWSLAAPPAHAFTPPPPGASYTSIRSTWIAADRPGGLARRRYMWKGRGCELGSVSIRLRGQRAFASPWRRHAALPRRCTGFGGRGALGCVGRAATHDRRCTRLYDHIAMHGRLRWERPMELQAVRWQRGASRQHER